MSFSCFLPCWLSFLATKLLQNRRRKKRNNILLISPTTTTHKVHLAWWMLHSSVKEHHLFFLTALSPGTCLHQTGVCPALSATPAESSYWQQCQNKAVWAALYNIQSWHMHSVTHLKRGSLLRDRVNTLAPCQSIFHYEKSVQLRNMSLLVRALRFLGSTEDNIWIAAAFLTFVMFHWWGMGILRPLRLQEDIYITATLYWRWMKY